MITFRYHEDILKRYPQLHAGIVIAKDLKNQPTSDNLRTLYISEQKANIERIGKKPLSEIEALAAWRAAFRAFGTDPTKYRSAPESLLRRLTKKGDIPSINSIVDISNLISIRYTIAVAAFDTRAIRGAVTVRFADGIERYTPLGSSQFEHPERGEVIFVDDSGLVIARRWCWRQSNESAANETTHNSLITIEAQHSNCQAIVESALNDLRNLLGKYVGGQFDYGLLSPETPEISSEII